MAKRRKINKSQKVRDYQAEYPDAKPSEVANALKRYGITATYVSNIKSMDKKKEEEGEKGGAKKTVSARPTVTDSGEGILAAARLIHLCGGVKEATNALRTAEKVAQELSN